ncbi:MAG TPA: hypothetical protein VFX61_13630 [Micromonosporaceae bacterium]|nr:hypothetical protein [Micromonosporaceae bacterium]
MLKSSKNRKIMIGIVGGILLLLCLVGLVGGLLRPGKEPSKRPSSAPAEAGMIPTPDPATRDSYIAALEAIDPDIVHGRTEKAVNRGRDLCTTIKYHSNDHERLVNETRKRFTSHRHPRGFGKQKAEQILAAVRRYICPTF